MTAPRASWLLPAAAMLCAAAALAAAVQTLRDTPARVRHIERRRSDGSQLAALAAARAADAARLADLTRAGPAAPLGDRFRELKPAWTAELRDADRIPLTADWSLQRVRVTMDDVNLEELDEVLRRLASAEAPWRPVEWTLTAAESAAGRARVSLLMEGLARTPGATP